MRQRAEFMDGFALLLDPRVVLLVVPALPVELRAFLYPLVNGGFAEVVCFLVKNAAKNQKPVKTCQYKDEITGRICGADRVNIR